jgi:serine phosphatase RsbU (regulator of sigma subunit)
MRNKLFFLFSILTIVCFFKQSKVYSQQTFTNKKRAMYITDIVKQVEWPAIDTITTFKIALLTRDKDLYEKLRQYSNEVETIKGKPVKILQFTSIEQIRPVQVLYLHKNSDFDIDRTLKATRGKGTLIISENFGFHKSMINFAVIDNMRRFELNEQKLETENLKVSLLLKAQAVQTEADWKELFAETEKQLEDEKERVAQQKKQISAQQKEIDLQKQQILTQADTIKKQLNRIKNQEEHLDQLARDIEEQRNKLQKNTRLVRQQEKKLEEQQEEVEEQKKILSIQKNEILEQNKQIEDQKAIVNEQLAKIKLQRLILYIFLLFIALIIALAFFIFRAYKIKKQANIQLTEKNRIIEQQHKTVTDQRDKLSVQNEEISRQKQEIMDSIHYARRIQTAVLPPEELITNTLPQHFILNKPRDVVSGDFYWLTQKGEKTIIVAADCTGHGVPGAFMSMLGVAFLNEIVNKEDIDLTAGEILDDLRDHVMHSLHQTGGEGESKDGMDMALCIIDTDNCQLEYAGAYNPLLLIREKEISTIKADKMPVAIHHRADQQFTNHQIDIKKGDCIYMFSDGYADQFGGKDNRKFMSKRFKRLLVEISDKQMHEQHKILDETIEDWRGDNEQVDDILVMGVRIP